MLALPNGGACQTDRHPTTAVLHSLMLALPNGGSNHNRPGRANKVALVDVGITEWRPSICAFVVSEFVKLHSLMLALPNGGSNTIGCRIPTNLLHSLMLALPNGGTASSESPSAVRSCTR